MSKPGQKSRTRLLEVSLAAVLISLLGGFIIVQAIRYATSAAAPLWTTFLILGGLIHILIGWGVWILRSAARSIAVLMLFFYIGTNVIRLVTNPSTLEIPVPVQIVLVVLAVLAIRCLTTPRANIAFEDRKMTLW